MIFGVCTQIENYELVRGSGYRSICLAGKDIAGMDEAQFAACLETIKSGPLQLQGLNSFCEPSLKLCGNGYDADALGDYTQGLCRRAQALGVTYIGIGCPGSRNLEPGQDYGVALRQFSDALRVICDTALPYGIDILLESVCGVECNFITTSVEAYELVGSLRIPNLHLVYDIYHEFMENQGVEVAERICSEIKAVHIARNFENARYYLSRASVSELSPYIKALERSGYGGEINLEAFVGDVKAEIPESLKILESMTQAHCAERE